MGFFDALGSAVTGLNANQAALQTATHNIANVNTEGYSRQRVEFTNQLPERFGNDFLGNGVQVGSVSRVFDSLVIQQLQTASSTFAQAETLLDNAREVDNILANPGTGVSGGLDDFFSALNTVSDDPANFGARESLLSESETLTSRLNTLNTHFDSLRTFVTNETKTFVAEVNQLTQNIADVNEAISSFPADARPSDLLDQRDQLVNKLAEQVQVSTIEQSDGALNVFIGNGQGVVVGNQNSALTAVVDPEDPRKLDITLAAGGAVATITDALVGGKIGGLNDFQNTVLDVAQNTIGQIAVGAAVQLNIQHRLGQDLNGNLGGDFFTEPTIFAGGNTNNTGGLAVSGTFGNTSNLTTSDYRLLATSATTFTLTRLDDNTVTNINTGGVSPFTSTETDGFTLTLDSTVAAATGDSFLIQPTRQAAGQINVALTTSAQIATALPIRAQTATNANGLGTNIGDGAINSVSVTSVANLPLTGAPVNGNVTMTFSSATNTLTLVPDPAGDGPLAYDPATENGKSFTILGGLTFAINNTPANGDSFVLSDNTNGVSDNGNSLLLAQFQTRQTLNGGTSSFNTTDSQLVTTVGTVTRSASINEEATEALFFQAKQRREEISGVNLDEEAANLIQFQKAFQANAQVISITSQLFDTLLRVAG
ncbi:MAG: flagellar hook-associated protein FlgK [Methylococcales bacterium]|jgi:flagellar hook-associated protein 1|nr:flagellar hook-associated protein FlgK [Methylococcales bacterium]